MPAEWEPHTATWLGWPHNASDWPGKFSPVPWVFGEMVRKIVPGETARIIVESPAHEAKARRGLSRAGVDLSRVEFFRFPTDRGWTRDSGRSSWWTSAAPRGGDRGFPLQRLGEVPRLEEGREGARRAARALGLRLIRPEAGGREVVLEGGAIDVNGRGTLIATEECLLDPQVQARNPGMTMGELEGVFGSTWGRPT
jgi:agmatine deiminase